MEMIAAEGLTKYYGKSLAVDHVSFTVNDGEVFGFLGPNGAGKTTTIKMLNTLIRIGGGRARVAGFDVATHGKDVRRAIGLVPQEMTLDRDMTGKKNLEIQAKLYDVPDDVAAKKIDELLDLVGLKSVAGNEVGTYSWGMQRRLEIALGLVHSPRVLFLDEPTLGLDAQSRIMIWDYIRKLNRDFKMTILLTTHYLEEADDLCDRIAIIDAGKIKAEGTPGDLKRASGGDIITLLLSETKDESELKALLGGVQGLTKLSTEGASVIMEAAHGDEAVPLIIEALSQRRIVVKSVEVRPRTLNQVFLEQVGKSLSVSEQDDGVSVIARARLLRETRN
ncbi:MAG TPA: ATP-binding cassette domain-containing protein [Nitrososphaerales archaeon]|nr:ATP-binding cassette domain-containing protein [Nitrososphaerales archaeon]